MGMFSKILRVGEGRKVKALESLVPEVNELEDEFKRLSDDQLRAKTGEFKGRLERGEDLDDLMPEAFATVREAARPHARPAPLRLPAHGWLRPPLRLGRRDEDRRGQDPRVDAARLPQRPDGARACTSSP